ncbi:MAG: DegV family protein [Clostridia bacterium]|nr:DegV family protein [Clostridia bacterium]
MKEKDFVIVSDSGSDMTEAYFLKNGIDCVNLGFTMNNVNYGGEDGEKIDIKDFYAKLRSGAMPTTYQATSESVKAHLSVHLKKGKDVLCIVFSSGLSGTLSSFQVAARELSKEYPDRKIIVVDSLCASMGEGLLLDYVVKKANSGASLEETAAYAEEIKGQIVHSFTVNDLYHLKRGGRVSGVTAFVGSLLKIKPVMHVNDEGKLVVVGKAMGRKKALATMVENLLKNCDEDGIGPFFISHGDCIEDAESVKAMLLARYPKAEITIGYIGSVIGSHSGAGTVALFCKGKHR